MADSIEQMADEYCSDISAIYDICDGDEIMAALFIETYKAGFNAPRWVSVKEELPEFGNYYLCFTADKTIERIYFMQLDRNRRSRTSFRHRGVTHWQNLPDKPE